MNYSIYRFTLDIHKTKSQVSIPVLYRDTGIKFYISLTDGGKPYIIEDGCRAVFSAKKHDGKELFNDCIIEDNTRIRYDFTAQTTNCEGMMNCEMRLYGKDGKLLTTPAFVVIVDPRVVYDSDILESYPESTTLDNIVASENARVEGEQERVDAEAVRVIVENARAAAETERVAAENARVSAEGVRADSEKTRVANEAERVEAFAHMLGSWVAYSAYEDGTDYTYTWSEGQRYIGICNGKTPPADKTGFIWSKFVDTGIYIGSGEMPKWCNLQIDPDGEVTEIVQEPGQSDMNVMSQKAVSNTFANALKGNASGEAVRIDDASPVAHEMAVKVKSKNLFPYPFYHKTKTQNGVTWTDNGDGTITTSGTATDTSVFSVIGGGGFIEGIAGKTVSISGCPKGGSTSTYYFRTQFKQRGGGVLLTVDDIGNGKFNVLVPDGTVAIDAFFAIRSGAGDSLVFKPQIELGATATTFAPHIEPSAAKVLAQGKNLLRYPYKEKSKTTNGITFTVNDDGTVLVDGTATAKATFTLYAENAPMVAGCESNKLVLSGCPSGGSSSTYYLFADWVGVRDSGAGVVLPTSTYRTYSFTLVVESGTTMNNLLFKPQVEVEQKSAYEPYIEPTEYAVNEDGTVDGVTPLDPTTTLMTDTAGAVLDVTYTRDANKVVNELTSRLAALEYAVLK